jgi:hypothetical protein
MLLKKIDLLSANFFYHLRKVMFSVAEFMTKMRSLFPCLSAGTKKKPLRFGE